MGRASLCRPLHAPLLCPTRHLGNDSRGRARGVKDARGSTAACNLAPQWPERSLPGLSQHPQHVRPLEPSRRPASLSRDGRPRDPRPRSDHAERGVDSGVQYQPLAITSQQLGRSWQLETVVDQHQEVRAVVQDREDVTAPVRLCLRPGHAEGGSRELVRGGETADSIEDPYASTLAHVDGRTRDVEFEVETIPAHQLARRRTPRAGDRAERFRTGGRLRFGVGHRAPRLGLAARHRDELPSGQHPERPPSPHTRPRLPQPLLPSGREARPARGDTRTSLPTLPRA